MPFNPTVFRQRAITAVLFAAAMVGGVFGGELAFKILFTVVGLGCLWEFFGLVMADGHWAKRVFYCACAVVLWLVFIGIKTAPFQWLMVLPGLVLLIELFDQKSASPFQNAGLVALSSLYVVLPLAALYEIATWYQPGIPGDLVYHPKRVLGLLLLTWSNDTFAYLVGSFIGKTPLFPRISPKKTWEGTVGGGLLTVALGWLLFMVLGEWDFNQWLALGATIALFGTLGDLVESMLKRSLGVKDSGSLLPGHGGMLDRFDAFLFMLPWAWLVLQVVR